MTQSEALYAKSVVKTILGKPNWLRGIGIGYDGQEFYVQLNVVMPINIRWLCPELDIRTSVVGNIEFQEE
jgi:hypothetical protein